MAMAVVDAQLRETGIDFDFKGSAKQLIEVAQANPEPQEMRRRRNALIHVNPDNPAITVDEQWTDRNNLEKEARKAVRLMFEVFFMNPGL